MFGIAGWSSGNQSVVPLMRLRGICLVLPGSVLRVVSVCAGLGGLTSPGASGGGGGAMAYAQSGICAVVAACSATERARGNAARMTSAANLRIKTLHNELPGLGAANYTPYHGAMKTTLFAALLALAGAAAAAQNPPAEPKNYSIDPWLGNRTFEARAGGSAF